MPDQNEKPLLGKYSIGWSRSLDNLWTTTEDQVLWPVRRAKLNWKQFVDVGVSASMGRVISSDVVACATIQALKALATLSEDFRM